ncbi:MAG: peptidyl-prolyl cis-trans isomerase [Planctomycetaceae bacterium]|nr:peptidyl-prolyl cis-trans isomerase [Planctomycetaceae bacterium]
MWQWRLLLTVLLAFAGCKGDSGLGPKVDNPVVGPPPPRKVGARNSDQTAQTEKKQRGREDESSAGGTGVELVRAVETDSEVPKELEGNRVVATVNGSPLFEAEILERYAEQLMKMREQVPEDQYRKQIDQLIERDLRAHVERKLLSEAMRRSLKKDQQKQIDGFMKKQLQEQLDQMKKEMKVTSTAELDRELQKHGTSLAMVEYQFRNKVLAQQYLAGKVKNNRKLSRQDLFAYYQQHLKEYEFKRRVKWQQIMISRANEVQARAKLRILADGLQEGRDFGEMAAEISDGSTAENKGLQDWTNEGSLADQKLEALLFELPIGAPSELIESPRSFQVVRVVERQNAGHVPFDEVQEKIRLKLLQTDEQDEVGKVIEELWDSASIDSEYEIKGYEQPSS